MRSRLRLLSTSGVVTRSREIKREGWIHMESRAWCRYALARLVASVAFVSTLLAPGAAHAAPTVTARFPIAVTAAREMGFYAAFDGTNWLLGIQGNNVSPMEITAQLLDQAGAPVGGRIDTGRTGEIAQVAFDGTNFLLAWEDDAAAKHTVYGQFFSRAGALVGGPFLIAPGGTDGVRLAGLAYGGGTYLVVYSSHGDGSDVFGRLVGTTGAVGGQLPFGPNMHRDGQVAFDGTNFFVLSLNHSGGVLGRFVAPDGTLGLEVTVNASTYPSDNNSFVAFDGSDYLVAWMDEVSSGDWNIYGQRVTKAGARRGGVFAINKDPGTQFLAGLAFDGGNWLVGITDMRNDADLDFLCDPGEGSCHDAYAQVVSKTGIPISTRYPITTAAGNQFGGVAGYGGGAFLLVINYWDTYGGAVGDVRGALATVPPNRSLTFRSSGTYDGWVLESSENSSRGGTLDAADTTLLVGDDAKDRQYRSFVSFNSAGLPDNAVILSARVKLRGEAVVGTNPFTTHRPLLVDVRKGMFGASPALQPDDFPAAAGMVGAGVVGPTPLGAWFLSELRASALAHINKSGLTQLRLRFQKDDNDDGDADFLKFTSGDATTAADRPALEILYALP